MTKTSKEAIVSRIPSFELRVVSSMSAFHGVPVAVVVEQRSGCSEMICLGLRFDVSGPVGISKNRGS